MTKKIKQDKEVGINPDFDEAEAGNPLCHACGTEDVKKQRGRPVKIGTEKHIRITDSDLTDKINLLMKIPGYGNFNKVINEALFYGLPILAEKIGGDAVTQEERAALTTPRKIGSREEKFYAVVRTATARSGAERDHQQVDPLVAVSREERRDRQRPRQSKPL